MEKGTMKGSFQDLINSEAPVLIDFHAVWCGPCKAMAPILKQVKEKLGTAVRIIKIDVDQNPALAQHYNIRGVPTLMLFKQGKALWQQSGVVPAQHIEQVVQQHS